jgi:hypothetical protein
MSQFQETDSDSTSHSKCKWHHGLDCTTYNCYPELKPEINIFSMAWPRFPPQLIQAAHNGMLYAHTYAEM